MLLVTLALLPLLSNLASCSRGDASPELVLDGRPRLPDAEGVVEQISFEEITLDGGRTYDVSRQLQSFSTYDLAATPMLHRLGQYVHLGLDGGTVEWMAGIGVVVRGPGAPVVYYNGFFLRRDGGRAIFRDGTALRLADGVTVPNGQGLLRAELDPARHEVRALVRP